MHRRHEDIQEGRVWSLLLRSRPRLAVGSEEDAVAAPLQHLTAQTEEEAIGIDPEEGGRPGRGLWSQLEHTPVVFAVALARLLALGRREQLRKFAVGAEDGPGHGRTHLSCTSFIPLHPAPAPPPPGPHALTGPASRGSAHPAGRAPERPASGPPLRILECAIPTFESATI